MKRLLSVLSAAAMVIASALPHPVQAQLTVDHRRELTEIRNDVGKASAHVRKKELDEAERILDDCQKRLEAVAKAAGLDAHDRNIMPVRMLIERQRELIARQKGTAGTSKSNELTFAEHIAPLLERRCGSCHGGNDPRAGLTLTTAQGVKQGGNSGPVVVPGSADQSLLVRRLLASGNQRMPRGAPAPLPAAEIQAIALWINQGAKFGDAAGKPPVEPDKPKPKIEIALATGNETVSFTRDIAPWLVNLCLNCHGGNNPRSGFSVETFEKIMLGGDSGRVVLPGNLDGSRLWDLVGKQDPIKMPQGQALITRKNWNDLRTWIEEGARFDGKDPTRPLRELVPTAEEMRSQELARLSPAEFAQRRLDGAKDMWERALPKEEPRYLETDEFFVFGNVAEARLKQIGSWADQHANNLRTLFRDKPEPLWKGKLVLFVFRDRFSFEEFNLIILKRETPREMSGHSVVTASLEEAYAALLDVGDQATADLPDMHLNVVEHVTAAYLQRGGRDLPDWLLRGTGLAIVGGTAGNNAYVTGMLATAREAVRFLARPEDLFADGTFSPTTIGPVGYTLVSFLRKAGGDAKLGQFIGSLQGGQSTAEAVRAVYATDLKTLAGAYFTDLQSKR